MAKQPDKPTPGPTPGKPTGSVIPAKPPSPTNPPTVEEHPGQSVATGEAPKGNAKRDTIEAPNQSSGAADGNRSTASAQGSLPEGERADQDGDGRPDPEFGDRPRHEGAAAGVLKPDPSNKREGETASAASDDTDTDEDDEPARAAGAPMSTPRPGEGEPTRQRIPTGPPAAGDVETLETRLPGRDTGARMELPPATAERTGAGRARQATADPAGDYWRLVYADAGVGPPHRTAAALVSVRPSILSAAGKSDAEYRADVEAVKLRKTERELMSKLPDMEEQLDDLKTRAESDAIGGPRQTARLERIEALKAEITRAKGSRKSMIAGHPRHELQQRRRQLVEQIHKIDGESVRAGVPEEEADRRTEDLRRDLAELEDEMSR